MPHTAKQLPDFEEVEAVLSNTQLQRPSPSSTVVVVVVVFFMVDTTYYGPTSFFAFC